MGVLPFLIILATVIFALLSDNFLTVRNLTNVARQSTYLVIVTMGQMLALLTGGFDLSVGTILALSSVVGAMVMSAMAVAFPDSVVLVISVGLMGGLLAGLSVGTVNGIGVSLFNVNPFMMTLGMSSVGFGVALYLTGGVPVYGLPEAFSNVFGFGSFYGIPTPVLVTAGLVGLMYFLVNWTKIGRYFYAVGGNIKASSLSGINTNWTLFLAYLCCSGMATISGLLLTGLAYSSALPNIQAVARGIAQDANFSDGILYLIYQVGLPTGVFPLLIFMVIPLLPLMIMD